MWFSSAAARAAAIDTARIALAPRWRLLGVASRSSIVRSMSSCSRASKPLSAPAIGPLMLETAVRTPLPRKRSRSPSRSSTASWAPVDAPEGTAARPRTPVSRRTSASTVGLPLESRISRPFTSTIADIQPPLDLQSSDPLSASSAARASWVNSFRRSREKSSTGMGAPNRTPDGAGTNPQRTLPHHVPGPGNEARDQLDTRLDGEDERPLLEGQQVAAGRPRSLREHDDGRARFLQALSRDRQ